MRTHRLHPASRTAPPASAAARRVVFLLASAAAALASPGAHAQGFQLNRYEPTPAGETFFAVDRPWYSSTRYFAAGVTLNYAHDPLVYGVKNADGSTSVTTNVVEHALLGHVDIAGSFLDRVTLSATLPITFLERGTPAGGAGPIDGAAVGDPRVGLMIRLWNHADKDRFSIHVGGQIWIPIGADKNHAGDSGVRGLPKVVIGGLGARHLRWSISAGYLVRSSANIGSAANVIGSTVGQELQIGFGLGYTDLAQTFHVGPELLFATVPTGGHGLSKEFTGMEVLVGAQYLIKKQVQIGAAVGIGILREPGTPDFRGLLRVAYAPVRTPVGDRDKDGILDNKDACPDDKGARTEDPATNGCPDRDGDGVSDRQDICPDEPAGANPDPARRGCPAANDRDGDGVVDDKDQCPDVPKGRFPDPDRLGCPADRDGDGVPDDKDQCPDVAAGDTPDPKRLGCPADRDHDGVPDDKDLCPDVPQGRFPDANRPGCPADQDHDGVIDQKDRCPEEPEGPHPDPDNIGCPLADRDHDNVTDLIDACPDEPGAPDPDPTKNGCPGLVTIKNGMIVILAPVFFATDKDVILEKSFPVLHAVANALKAQPEIKRVAVEGHTDSQGKLAHNMDLSDRRAKSVMKWLITVGAVDEARLEAQGFGPTRPLDDNKSIVGRAANRRVEFHIVDPAAPTQH